MPLLFLIKNIKRAIFILIANALLLAFQMISLITKNIGLILVTDKGLLIGIIYSIDVTLMVILYYLYSNTIKQKKEKK
jgi:hypothetical protein